MFDPIKTGRVFGIPPGADFPQILVQGLLKRARDLPPEYLARVELFVNTRRMQRKITAIFDSGPARLLPRIRLITDLYLDIPTDTAPPTISPLAQRLEIISLITALIEKEPGLAPRGAIFDLADSLIDLFDEMHDEGVSSETVLNLDVTDKSGHWARSQKFLEIATKFIASDGQEALGTRARQRLAIEGLVEHWQHTPPSHPVIIAGSTGSRGSTSLLMSAAARLPNGAVILPGFDFDLPQSVWEKLDDPNTSEGHPQFRLANIIRNADIRFGNVPHWYRDAPLATESRNKLFSLALRPAPVTSEWVSEGPKLQHVDDACKNLTLLEAPSERSEALAIALILRQAAETNQTAALVTPDKNLSRRVRAALAKWHIEPDVSAGEPLAVSLSGRLFRHVADVFDTRVSLETLMVILKHPLVCSGGSDRLEHLTLTRELELFLRKRGAFTLSQTILFEWCEKCAANQHRGDWVKWFSDLIFRESTQMGDTLSNYLFQHLDTVEKLVGGPNCSTPPDIWSSNSGAEMRQVFADMTDAAPHADPMNPADYGILFSGVLKRREVRDPLRPHPNIMIWGTLEARVQGASLVILGGLNEGTWPGTPTPDPWLNRDMRLRAGLLLPDRQIGLSSHDFQQAVAAENVVLSRSIRDDDSQTVPSRWISRLTNLLGGIGDHGQSALVEMRERGNTWLDMAVAFETPESIKPEPRPAPSPPPDVRPKSLSVTSVTRLIRDPYAIYAKEILRLKPLEDLLREPDARTRGIVMHRILELFIRQLDIAAPASDQKFRLLQITDDVMEERVPWPTARMMWRAHMERIADTLLKDEKLRQIQSRPVHFECRGDFNFAEFDFALTAIADRVDLTPDGQFVIYDYKTGKLPTKPEMENFEKQLMLEALLLNAGGFKDIGRAAVSEIAYVGLGTDTAVRRYPVTDESIGKIRKELGVLISEFTRRGLGYSSRRAVANLRFSGDYDHLARFGEWDDSDLPVLIGVGN